MEKKTKWTSFRCPPKLWEQIKMAAVREHTTFQDLCVRALTEYLRKPKEERVGQPAA